MEEIFCKQVPFFFKASEREERKCHVRVQMGYDSNIHDSRKELVVKLTNDQDLFFLYTLHLAEEDFQSLKIQQGLLVDFTAFPQKVVDLLVLCLREEEKENPKFIVQFVEGSGALTSCTMNIVETNPFRHLNHLSLKFLPGSDADVKSHLAGCLKQLKESYSLIQHKFEHTSQDLTAQLQEKEQMLRSKSSELDSLKQEWSSRQADISSKHKEDLALEKEKTIQFQSNLQLRFEKERREMEQIHSKMVKQLESRIADLEASNKDLTDTKYKSEATIRDYKGRHSVLEEENRRIKSELQTLRKENGSLDSVRLDMDKTNNSLQTRVAVLEQELRDKAELLEKSNDLLLSEKEKRKRAEAETEKRQKEISRLEAKTKAMSEELKKGNEIIKKLQGEIKSYHAKVKLRTQIATEQEKLLGEKDQELEKLRQDLAKTKDTLRETQDKNEKLTHSLEQATQKLEESKKVLKTNENMIQWLNKQINEQKVSQHQMGTFEMTSGQIKPSPLTLHNYSTSSHGSVMTHDDPRAQHFRQRPTSAQVQYQPQDVSTPRTVTSGLKQNGLTSALPNGLTSSLSVGLTSTSVTSSPNDQHTSTTVNRNPLIDPKFLMRRDEAIPVRGVLANQSSAVTSYPSSISNQMTSIPSSNTHTNLAKSSSVIRTSSTSLPTMNVAQSQQHIATSSQPGTSHMTSRPLTSHPLLPSAPVRLSQDLIIPKSQPPLASAYFPNQAS